MNKLRLQKLFDYFNLLLWHKWNTQVSTTRRKFLHAVLKRIYKYNTGMLSIFVLHDWFASFPYCRVQLFLKIVWRLLDWWISLKAEFAQNRICRVALFRNLYLINCHFVIILNDCSDVNFTCSFFNLSIMTYFNFCKTKK